MHVLITNDDGPPCAESPFVDHFVAALRRLTDWDISVALPNTQKSWISKAHVIGETITASFVVPRAPGDGFDGPYAASTGAADEWVLLDGTPASCTQLGVHHLFAHKGPVDLVISGPNFGRNSTALFILSSGTVGAALEGALCGVPSIGLSFAYSSRDLQLQQTEAACAVAVKLVSHLVSTWPKDGSVDLYSINIPLATASEDMRVEYTHVLPNRWGSAFEPVGELKFRWKPDLQAVNASSMVPTPAGNDGYAVSQGFASVTPLKANYQGVPGLVGELKLPPPPFTAVVSHPRDSYVYPLIVQNLRRLVPAARVAPRAGAQDVSVVHFGDYEDLDFDRMMADKKYLACSYVFRKALIRKHFLSHAVATFTAKNPASVLATAFPESYSLELDYAEYLDEALDDLYELRDELALGQAAWILKPSMSDRGQGIRIFRTLPELRAIFEEFDNDETEHEDGVVTSQLRDFVVQRYVSSPLLLAEHGHRKFHIRAYVVAAGAVKVYVYADMLALFALKPYAPDEPDLAAHLTNTCLQGDRRDQDSVLPFWSLRGLRHDHVFSQIKAVTAAAFGAALGLGRMHFQPVPNAFEVYGVDFLVDETEKVYLLEVNAYPDFAQTGTELVGIVDGLFASVVADIVAPYFGVKAQRESRLELVLDQDVSGNW